MTRYEKEWLDYARGVITCEKSTCICPNEFRRIRWPGYIGANYDYGRVLLVGAIHNTNRLFTNEIIELEPIARKWSNSKPDSTHNQIYLKALRKAYINSIPQWQSWLMNGNKKRGAVWSNFQKIVDSLEIGWEHIAFTNLAKCHTPTQSDDTNTIISCATTFSIEKLVTILNPVAIFIAKDERVVNPATPIAENSARFVRRYNNRNGVSKNLKIREWLLTDAKRYRMLLEK
jgi:hypothetical protein